MNLGKLGLGGHIRMSETDRRLVESAGRTADFDELLGQWTAEEAAEFDRAMAEIRRVDAEDWKD